MKILGHTIDIDRVSSVGPAIFFDEKNAGIDLIVDMRSSVLIGTPAQIKYAKAKLDQAVKKSINKRKSVEQRVNKPWKERLRGK